MGWGLHIARSSPQSWENGLQISVIFSLWSKTSYPPSLRPLLLPLHLFHEERNSLLAEMFTMLRALFST